MKALIAKGLLVGLCTLAICATADAGWKCKMHNAAGANWYGTGWTRTSAAKNAMKFCSKNSVAVRNCVVDGCWKK